MALLVSVTFHCKRSQREMNNRRRRPIPVQRPAPGPYGDLGDGHPMDQPLLEDDNAVEESKEDPDEHSKRAADVQFV